MKSVKSFFNQKMPRKDSSNGNLAVPNDNQAGMDIDLARSQNYMSQQNLESEHKAEEDDQQ